MNTISVPYVIKSSGAVTMYINGESVTVAQDHPNYNRIIDSLKTGRHDKLENLVNISKAVKAYVARATGHIKIKDGVITYDDMEIHNTLTTRILKMMSEGYQFDHMLRFLENLMLNPSKRSVQELYTFLENYGLPITDDGCFLAYKAVRNDYFDIYTGRTHQNLIGSVQKMARNMVDDNWGKDCSQGLHCGALDYVVDYGHFVKGQIVPNAGNRLIIVKVNPMNVISVPDYAKFTKMRVCEYTVIDEIKDVVKELDKVVYKGDSVGGVTPSVPDRKDDTKSDSTQSRTMLSANDNVSDYIDGYNDGGLDKEMGDSYGYTRDYSGSEGYRKGYNDGYNGREYQADDDTKVSPAISDADRNRLMLSEDDNSFDYTDGFHDGNLDNETGEPYGYTRDYSGSEGYRKGYNDGYNGRENQRPDAVIEHDDDDDCQCSSDCSCGCHCDEDTQEAIEYTNGFDCGQEDAREGDGFQTSLNVDDTDSFKIGYRAGYHSEDI
jgi:hypothetical protein